MIQSRFSKPNVLTVKVLEYSKFIIVFHVYIANKRYRFMSKQVRIFNGQKDHQKIICIYYKRKALLRWSDPVNIFSGQNNHNKSTCLLNPNGCPYDTFCPV